MTLLLATDQRPYAMELAEPCTLHSHTQS